MKTLLNPSDKKEIVRRLQNDFAHHATQMGQDVRSPNGVSPQRRVSRVRWREACGAGAGKHSTRSSQVGRALDSKPKGFKAAPELDQHIGGTPGGSIAAAVYALNPPLRRCPPPNELPAVDPFAVRQVKGRLKRLADGAYGRKYRDTLAQKKTPGSICRDGRCSQDRVFVTCRLMSSTHCRRGEG